MVELPTDSHPLHRWMLFVDGENFTIRAQRLAENQGLDLIEGSYYSRDAFLWLPRYQGHDNFYDYAAPLRLQPRAIRAHYYAGVVGDDNKLTSIREAIWSLGFQPQIFKKGKQDNKAKGVDIALTKDLLGNAYRNNYDVAVLITGDGDFVPLVEEVKGLGKLVYVAFFNTTGLSSELRLASDMFFEFERNFTLAWRTYDPSETAS